MAANGISSHLVFCCTCSLALTAFPEEHAFARWRSYSMWLLCVALFLLKNVLNVRKHYHLIKQKQQQQGNGSYVLRWNTYIILIIFHLEIHGSVTSRHLLPSPWKCRFRLMGIHLLVDNFRRCALVVYWLDGAGVRD